MRLFRGTPFEPDLPQAIAKLGEMLPASAAHTLSDQRERIPNCDPLLAFFPPFPHRGRRGKNNSAAKPLPLKAIRPFLPPTGIWGQK